MNKNLKTVCECFAGIILSFIMAINYEILIFENSFAPAGVNGLATIIQHVFHFQIGYMSLLINIPLLIISFFMVDRLFTFKTFFYVIGFSFFTLIMKNGDTDNEGIISLSNFIYKTESTSHILAPIASGVISGLIYGISFRMDSSTGGTDILARLLRVKRPELSLIWVIFGLNLIVAVLSYFAYAENGKYNIEPVILCIIYSFIASKTGDYILQGHKKALKFEVVTSYPEEISAAIIKKLNHSATVTHAQGMYSHSEKSLLICVVDKNQIVEFEKIIKAYSDTFAYVSEVNEVVGKFVHSKKKIVK